MRFNLNLLKASVLMVFFALFMVSCEEDVPGGGGTNLNDPEITLNSNAFVNVGLGESFEVDVNAKANGVDLNSIAVYQGGSLIPASRIKFDGVDASANPKLLFDADRSNLATTITILAHDTVGEEEYVVRITDNDNNTDEVKIYVTTIGNPPSVSIFGSGTITVDEGQSASLTLTASKGSVDLQSLTVYINDELVEASKLELAGVSASANPIVLEGSLVDGFEDKLFIMPPSTPGDYNVKVLLTDTAGQEATATYVIRVKMSGTPVEQVDELLLLYNSDGQQKGALDLDAATSSEASVTSSSTDAEIRDLGIDTDQPGSSNWIQKIEGVNGASLRQIVPGQNGVIEGFTFGDIATKEQLDVLYSAGVVLDNNTSAVVNAGDLFIVENNGKKYALVVTEVSPTTGNNDDYYIMDMKR